ncbi:hypothetical protein PR202_gb22942 [Eleusine coracana subsp. coracana]|uniref:NB-ARC domain-containing protein n=1 Tax=Eleusine coracana subsp. coracana TaxID=191504 RepID=A0AAV5FHF1_ELECO|nr:hypothetical protein PR202_gb22942 [Eleusine coracana subsp. coracana]
METATAAVGSVLRKLQAYLSDHKEEDHCSGDVKQLSQEFGHIHAALLGSAGAQAPPPGQPHDEPAAAWTGDARELAYDVEDAVDDLLVASSLPGSLSRTITGLLQRATDLSRARPQTPAGVPAAATVVDYPRKKQQLPPPPDGEAGVIGVDDADARDGLIRRLRLHDEAAAGDEDDQVKVVSVVGPVGMGKTTLAGAAYGVLKARFHCAAFVSVGLDPDITEVLESALQQLGVSKEANAGEPRDEALLVSQLREFLQNKRYLIVLDDVWEKSSWEKIRSALADNHLGSRIVTTTRNLDFADEVGATYELKPLSSENSKKLFFRTVFGCEDKQPGDEFTAVADKILEKCGGVPLAIITLGKLLAVINKVGDKGEWQRVCESIGSTLEDTPEMKNMRMTVSTGFYNLPPHLRTCLLYMSIFPENYEIRRDRLIWRWIAEGSVRPGDEQEESLFEIGQSYFDELVNRSMIQFLDIDFSDDGYRDEYCCSVSFPVMDFIRYLSDQENFVTVLDGEQGVLLPSDMPVRRVSVRVRGGGRKAEDVLSSKRRKAEDSASLGSNSMSVPQLRSLTVFSPATLEKSIDLKMCSKFLRVLDLEGCDLSESELLPEHLGSLVHLRYLGLRETRIASVPEEIGNLKFLQTLDLDENLKVFDLPASITRLGELTCLRVSTLTRLPSGIGSLTALEELSDVSTRYTPDLVNELGSLTKLRTLEVYADSGGDESEKKKQLCEEEEAEEAWWAPPRSLVEFRGGALNAYWSPVARLLLPPLRRFDAATAAAAPKNLAVLVAKVAELRQRDVDALGTLPALRVLRLEPYATAEAIHVSGGGGACFPRLTECRFRDADVAPVFGRGAMPRLRRLEICFNVRKTVDLGNGGFEFGLENLLCLEEVSVYVGCQESTEPEAEAAEAALRRAADGHPNRAAFDVITFGEELMCFDD